MKNTRVERSSLLDRYAAYDSIVEFVPSPCGDRVAMGMGISDRVGIWLQENRTNKSVTRFSKRNAIPIAWNSSGKRLLFRTDFEGNEEWQLHVLEPGGTHHSLIFQEGTSHYATANSWSPARDRIVFVDNRDDKSRYDLYIIDVDSGEETLLLRGPGGYSYPLWYYPSHIILCSVTSTEDSTIFDLDLRRRELISLTPHVGEALFNPIGPWQNGFLCIIDDARDLKCLSYFELGRNVLDCLWQGSGDVECGAVGKRFVLFSANQLGLSYLYMMDLYNRSVFDVPFPEGVVRSIKSSFGRDIFFIAFENSASPLNVFRLEPKVRPERITNTLHGSIPEKNYVMPVSFYYESFDSRQIHALIYKPKKSNIAAPLLLLLHDGPQAQARPYYSPVVQYLLANGIAVAEPNFRGSSGYGKRFQKLIRRDWGGGELRDVDRFLSKFDQSWVDRERLGVAGVSFGGFLALSCITRLSRRWRAAAEWSGPSNLVSLVSKAKPQWKKYLTRVLGNPNDPRDLKRLHDRSPSAHLDQIRCPLLIVQGANDPKISKTDTDAFVHRARIKGVPVQYVVFEDEGHEILKRDNIRRALQETAEFFVKHLKA